MAHVSQEKKQTVDQLVKLMQEYPIVGTVNMANLPAPQLQNMRTQLRDSVVLIMAKRRLIKIALDKAKDKKQGIEQLAEHLQGMPAIIFTKNNPFALKKTLDKNKSSAPAKAGQIAPNDLVIPAGPTPFAPGPVIGELGSVGVKTGVENGKVAVKEDSVVAKSGDEIKPKVAELLTRLSIEPMEVGLDLTAAYEQGIIYTKDVLSIDEQEYIDNVNKAAQWAFNLAIEASYPTADTVQVLITKAAQDAQGLGREQKIMAKELMPEFLEQAERSMQSLKTTANISDQPSEPKPEESSKEEPKAEEKPEEKKEEPKPSEEKAESTDDAKPASEEKSQ